MNVVYGMNTSVVEVLPHGRLALARQHAHDLERDLLDPHGLSDRIGTGAKQIIDHGLAQHDHLGAALNVRLVERGCHSTPASRESREIRARCH
jgi:hypothetical protein